MHAFLCLELQHDVLRDLVEIVHGSFYDQPLLLQHQLLSLSKRMRVAISSQPLSGDIDTKYGMTTRVTINGYVSSPA